MLSDIDRKMLWGRAGSRCAICNVELTQLDGHDVIVGDEAHIRSKVVSGPRHDPDYPAPEVDSYANRILLCKAHHKLIDDNADVFPAEQLDDLKRRHEDRVAKALGGRNGSPWVEGPELSWIVDGTQFASLVSNADAFITSHVHPTDPGEASLIADALQSATDWGDISESIGPAGRVDAAMDLQGTLETLLERGLMVIGGLGRYRHASGVVFPTAVIRIERVADLADAPPDGET